MSGEGTRQPWSRWAVGALLLLVVVLVALSPTFGRARPTGAYRPPLPPDALTNGCYPLPGGVKLDFPYQVRSDGDVDGKRILVVQYDTIDRDAAVEAVKRSFAAGGYGPPSGDTGYSFHEDNPQTVDVVLEKQGAPFVLARVTPLSPLKKDQIVRGTITLTLPVEQVQSDAPVCSDVTSTKRFPSDEASHDVGVPGGIN